MDSLKTVVIVALMAAVGYGVYVSITRGPKQNTSDPGVAPVWNGNGKGQPGAGGSNGAANTGTSGLAGFPFASGAANSAGPAKGAAPGGGGLASLGPPAVSPGTLSGGPPPGAAMPGPPTAPLGRSPEAPLQPPPGYPAIVDRGPAAPQSPAPNGPEGVNAEALGRFASFMQAVQTKLEQGRLDDALRDLSRIYGNPALPPDMARELMHTLDQLAGTVIYSRQHLVEPPYRVQPGETLAQIAQRYKVPKELLARINGIRDGNRLAPGQELKVVRGPFTAVVDLDRCELTLILDDRYAGRFPIGVGRDPPRLEGTYQVLDKIAGPEYVTVEGRRIPPGDPDNPLGRLLLDLGNQIGIHGSNDARNVSRTDGRGAICLGDRDIDDLYGILSIGSRVVIRR